MQCRPMSPRLVAASLDGVIVRSDGSISARTIAAVARTGRAGAQFVLVTAQPPELLPARALGHRGLAVCANGTLVYDVRTERIIAQRPVDASAPGVGRASALALLAARLGIPAAAVLVIGGRPEDLPMLAWAGLSCAVADAPPEVLAAADHIVAGADDDGPAQALERLFPA